MGNLLNSDQVVAIIKKKLDGYGWGGRTKLAMEIGVHQTFISNIIHKTEDPSVTVLDFFGIEKVTMYRFKK